MFYLEIFYTYLLVIYLNLSLQSDNTWRCMYSFVLLMMGGGTA